MTFSTKSFAAGALAALVLGSGTAVAATGGNFILGKANSAGKPTTLTNPNGTALVLNSKAGTPSLRVNRPVKVPNLHADKLDGLEGSALALRKGKTGMRWSTDDPDEWDINGDNVPDLSVAFVDCPAGTIATGGGPYNPAGVPVFDSFGQDTFWIAMTTEVGLTADDFGVNVTCYNPRGNVAPQFRTAPTEARYPGLSEFLADR